MFKFYLIGKYRSTDRFLLKGINRRALKRCDLLKRKVAQCICQLEILQFVLRFSVRTHFSMRFFALRLAMKLILVGSGGCTLSSRMLLNIHQKN